MEIVNPSIGSISYPLMGGATYHRICQQIVNQQIVGQRTCVNKSGPTNLD
jgi:hypothetical protein